MEELDCHRKNFPLPLDSISIYRENLQFLHKHAFVTCSLFTPNQDKYYRAANRLAESCERLGLPYSIYKVPVVHTSINLSGLNDMVFTKANFIAHNMFRFPGKNILYVDVDVLFVGYPNVIEKLSKNGCQFAIYNWLDDEHNEAYAPIISGHDRNAVFSEFYAYSHCIQYYSNVQLICSGGIQFYGNSENSRNLLQAWQEVIAQNPYSADDECLDYAFNNLDLNLIPLKPVWLDKSYLRLPWWPHIKPVVLHPELPVAGGNRVPLTEKDNKRRFYPGKCIPKTVPLYFPADCIIDTKRRLLLKVVDAKIVNTQSIDQEFWVYNEDIE